MTPEVDGPRTRVRAIANHLGTFFGSQQRQRLHSLPLLDYSVAERVIRFERDEHVMFKSRRCCIKPYSNVHNRRRNMQVDVENAEADYTNQRPSDITTKRWTIVVVDTKQLLLNALHVHISFDTTVLSCYPCIIS